MGAFPFVISPRAFPGPHSESEGESRPLFSPRLRNRGQGKVRAKVRKVWKIGSRWDDNGAAGTSILDTIFIPNGIVFTTTTLCLEIMEGDLFAIADGVKIVAIAEATTPAFRMDRLCSDLHPDGLDEYMDHNCYGCKVQFWRLDEKSQFDYKKRGKLFVAGCDIAKKVNEIFNTMHFPKEKLQ